MKIFWQKSLKEKVQKFDIFELGNSAVIYYFLMLFALPLAIFLNLPSKYVEYFIGQNINVLTWRAAFYLIVGILCFVIGYRFSNFKKPTQKIASILKSEWNSRKVIFVFIFLFLGGLVIKAIRILGGGYFHLVKSQTFTSSSFYSLIGLLDWLGPIALAIAFIYYFHLFKIEDSHYKIWQVIAWSVFIFEFVYGFFSVSRFSAIIPIVIYLIVKHYLYRRSFLRIAAGGLFILLILMPLQNFYRNPEALFKGYSTTIDHQVKIELKAIQQFTFDSSIGRISQTQILSKVFEKTDKFLYGRTFKEFLTSFGPPRFIWKNKPLSINAYGNELGRRLGILNPDDFGTSIAPTIIGDWYINFGLSGIIFGMFFIGMIFRFIYDFLIKNTNASLSGVMIYSIFWIQIIKGTEDWIAPVWAGLVKLLVILLIIHFFLTKQSKL